MFNHNSKYNMNFVQSTENQPHFARCKEILTKHPEIGSLMTRTPATALVLIFIVVLQVTISALSSATYGFDLPYWSIFLLAFCIGAFTNHSLYVIIHESTHNLIFQSRFLNKICGCVADWPNLFPGSMAFRNYHIKHHAHQGDYDNDADLANHWEAKLIGNSTIGKAIWLLFFPLFQLSRPARLTIKLWEPWVFINLASALAFDFAIFYFFGIKGLVYLLFSFFLSIGLHPLGARWIQEHYIVKDDQETYSYYGPLNFLALNVGYHNEHHDFPAVPWNNLPKVRAIAPEFYNNLYYHTSWTKLLFKFLLDSKMSLYSRVERIGDGKVSFDKK
jgi:sphingolipid delta-4 desaturase